VAISIEDVTEKTVPESDLKVFLENYLSIEQIMHLLQLKYREAAARYILPKEMKMIELFYIPTDKQGNIIQGAEKKQLKTRYYVPKQVWAQYLSEHKWAKQVYTTVKERFTFTMGRSIKKLLIIQQITPEQIDPADLFNSLHLWRRRNRFNLLQEQKETREFTPISQAFLHNITKICSHLSIICPDNIKPLTYYDPVQALWLLQTGLYDFDYLLPYNEEFNHIDVEERFSRYTAQLDLFTESKEVINLVRGKFHPLELLNPENRDQFDDIRGNKIKRLGMIDEIIRYQNQLKQIEETHAGRIPGVHMSRTVNEQLIHDYHELFDLLHYHKVDVSHLPESYHPSIFRLIVEVLSELLILLSPKTYKLSLN